jgi:hypothetical protein
VERVPSCGGFYLCYNTRMKNQPPVEAESRRSHRRQLVWQIMIPFLVMAGLIIASAVLIVRGGGSRVGVWADISLIWIIIPVLLISLVLVFVTGLAIYGMAKLLQIIPRYTSRAQYYSDRISRAAGKAVDGAIRPLVWIKQAGAVINSLFK